MSAIAVVLGILAALALPSLARANEAANIDQCRNGTVSDPVVCAGSAWVNGNLGETNSHYREGESVPFRATLTGIDTSVASHSVVVEYDTLQSEKHAYDYLTAFDRTETLADPTTGLGTLAKGNCFPIPVDLLLAFTNPGSTQVPGCIQIWNGTITGLSYGVADASDKRSLTITFSASDPTVLVAWGGHVASQIDWGLGNSASAISGSPYHMRLLSIDSSQLGNQDRSIKASAILPIPPNFTTQANPSAISLGQPVTDTATLSGSNGAVTGTVTFFVCGPAGSNPDCTFGGTKIGDAKTIVAGAAVSDPFVPSASGNYCIRAEYAPDSTAPYSPSVHTDLTAECFSVSNPSLTVTKTADAASVSAGDQIGFTIEVGNPGPGTALGVSLSDPLPAGAGISWSIDATASDSGCSIASNTLSCSFGDVGPTQTRHVHIISPTTAASCKAYSNTATAQATNNASVQASARVGVDCPNLALTKVADAETVSAGDQIGFTITVTNNGAGTAKAVSVSDPLPAASGTSWSIDAANSTGDWTVGGGTLTLAPTDLAPSATVQVHVVSPTTKDTCGTVNNEADLVSTNGGSLQASASVAVNCGEIGLTKTADAETVSAGDEIGFTISVHNGGTGTARGVSVSDTLPTNGGLDFSVDSANSDAGCSIAAGALTCDFGDLAPSATRSVHLVSPTTSASCGAVANTASVTTTNDGAAQDSASVTVDCPDVSVQKTAAAGTIDAGEAAGFTIVVSNAGPGVARNVTLADPLPAGVSWDDDSADCSIAAGVLDCSFGDLAAGAERVVHVTGDTGPADCGVLHNTATASATNEGEQALENNGDTAELEVDCPDVKVVKTADDASVSAGDPIGFTITVSNLGPGAAHDVEVDDQLPTSGGLQFSIDDQSDAGVCSLNVAETELHCSKAALPAGASFSVHLVSPTSKDSCGEVVNTATASASNEPESESANNSDDATTRVDCAGISISKEADEPSVSAGDELGFTITATNAGPGTAFDVHVDDVLPQKAGLEFSIADQSDAGVCSLNAAGTELHCAKDRLAAGASFSVHVVSATSAETCGPIENTASVATSNDGKDSDSATVVVHCPDLKVVKTADAERADAGDTVGFTITVSNIGSGVARGVTLHDPLPAGISWTVAGEGCSIAQGTLDCSFGDIAPAGTRTVHVSGKSAPKDCGTLQNTAVASATNEAEEDLENNDDSASITVECPALRVVKTADGPVVKAGAQLGFTITVSSGGPGTAKDVRVSDTLPSNGGLSFSIDAAKSDSGCAIAGGTLSCSFGDLASGQSRSVHIVSGTTTATCGTVANTASATSSNGGSGSASSSVTVTCPVIDLAITKTDSPDPVLVGDQLTYTLVVTNNGPDPATNAVVTDSLPSEVTFVSATSSQGTCSAANPVTCHLGTVPVGATITIVVVVKANVAGKITNTAVVAGVEPESTTANNTASADTVVNGPRTPPVCYRITVRPRSLIVGRRTLVRIAVHAGRRAIVGASVVLRGAGIQKAVVTRRGGMARSFVRPKRPGIVQVRVAKHRSCATQEIAVMGAFVPRFTG